MPISVRDFSGQQQQVKTAGDIWPNGTGQQPSAASASVVPAADADMAKESTALLSKALLDALASVVRTGDTPSALSDKGMVVLGVRRDADTVGVDASGDYLPLFVDEAGRLKVSTAPANLDAVTGNIGANGASVVMNVSRASNVMAYCYGTFNTVNCTFEGSLNSTNGTDGNWFTIQAVRSNANTIETATGNLSAAPTYAWELSVNGLKWFRVKATAWSSGTQTWVLNAGSYATEPIPAAQASATQAVSGSLTSAGTTTNTPVTPTTSFTNSAATTNATLVKNSAGTVWSVIATNTSASARTLKLYNMTTAPTVGTSVPVLSLTIPAGGVAQINGGSNGIRFGTGISFAITAGSADSDTAVIAASEVKVAVSYT